MLEEVQKEEVKVVHGDIQGAGIGRMEQSLSRAEATYLYISDQEERLAGRAATQQCQDISRV